MNNGFHAEKPAELVKYGKLSFPKKYNAKRIIKKSVVYAILIIITLGFLVPYLWLISSSFKTVDGFSSTKFSLLPLDGDGKFHMVFENYSRAWTELKIPQVFLNTIIVCVVNTAANLFLNAISAYAFARMKFRGRDQIFKFTLMSMMIPGCVMLIPNFIICNALGMYDSLTALIFPFLMSIYNIFLLRQQFMAVEKEIEEAALIDGAGRFTIFMRICMPIVKPMLIVLGITTFMWNYNNYLWPLLVLNSEENFTLSISLGTLMQNGSVDVTMYPVMLAGAVMVSAPMILVFFLLQKYILGGTMAGAVKG
ncbi:MAG: carbohydrate ABC transporter permease [Corallococcus sp.]|nr:carbohydrate ABC transporter permease [Corallococcus sp.]MCM1360140.1 carbohydrate ABC transporter permease [Corallococcus sp.]MCM1395472.1 carbohydrate ABC transporter permease [Corallococcus sp.]